MRRFRLPVAVTLAAVLLCSPWLACLPLCIVAGHHDMASAGVGEMMHVPPCHTGRAMQREIPVPNPPVIMLPTTQGPDLPPLRVAVLPQPSPHPLHLQQVSTAEPPPPRPV